MFKIGDRVKAIHVRAGKDIIGTIKVINSKYSYGVIFDEHMDGHDLDGTVPPRLRLEL